jgi:hypothetical protein
MAAYGKKAQAKIEKVMDEFQARHAQERAERQEGDDAQAGDCDRHLGSAPCRREGSGEDTMKRLWIVALLALVGGCVATPGYYRDSGRGPYYYQDRGYNSYSYRGGSGYYGGSGY